MNTPKTSQENFCCVELEGDTFTPIGILQKLSGNKKFLLESSLKHKEEGRYSFIGCSPAFELVSYGETNQIIQPNGEKRILKGNPISIIKNLLPAIEGFHSSLPLFAGGVGYIGYDIVRQFENIGGELKNELQMPDVHLMFYEEMVIFDHLEKKVYIAGMPLLEESTEESIRKRIEKRQEELKAAVPYQEMEEASLSGFEPLLERNEFIKKVETAKEHIINGDIFQVVLSQRMKSEFKGSPLSLYRKHRAANPTPYMFYIDFEEYTVIGSSPESLVKTRGKKVTVNPIAGTKKRGNSTDEDVEIARELATDEKELAEHRMLVDLGRNDLGRVCEFGTVSVQRYMEVEKFTHVMHLVSEVTGELKEGETAIDALAACLPAGTVSGAPKVRAMEIINNLENSRRGLYSGAVGYLSAGGDMDFALAIRTAILKDGAAYIQAGAGIVLDSQPVSEYEETINKLKSFLGGK
ncbi:anthranilate synthase component I [Neobacillus terrae]|uniref:anthranilate synthase component I n=1 Tax=Neobacillus terrae TaxID=3034837 RepID=UPI00140E05F9|nr:anthranilate synthase component I [Neobacillus terrae]NHM29380.1 anthranilate synthase component I [Neobacillus terrae]